LWQRILWSYFEDGDIGEIAVALAEIEAIAHYELIGDVEADVIHGYLDLPSGWFVEESDNAYRSGSSGGQILKQIVQRKAGIEDVFDQDNVPVFEALVQILENSNFAAALGGGAVAADGNEVEGDTQINRPDQICVEYAGSFQNSNQVGQLPFIVPGDLGAQFPNSLLDSFLIQ
jgi:hypothetical protein